MKKEDVEAFIKLLLSLPFKEHREAFIMIKKASMDRLSKEAETMEVEGRELKDFIKAQMHI